MPSWLWAAATSALVRSSKAALQLCALLRTYGLIRDFRFYEGARANAVEVARQSGGLPARGRRVPFAVTPRVGTRYRAEYLLVDLAYAGHSTPDRATATAGISGGNKGVSGSRPAALELLRAPSRRTALRISCAELRTQYPHRNVLYLLETPRGIVTSEEALRFGLGGMLLARLRL